MLHPKKVGTLPVEGRDKEKQTNEIKTAIPLLKTLNIRGKTITADALLTQRDIAKWLVEQHAHYHFTVKGNQKTLLDDIACHFNMLNQKPGYEITQDTNHGRIETRKIWTTTELNKYLLFPHIGQVFMIERTTINKKTDKQSKEVAYGITSKNEKEASPEQVLKDNRGHWSIESHHYIIDWNFQEDLSRIRTGYGPENITRLRRFAISIIKSKKKKISIARTMRNLCFNTRAVFDYLKMTRNSCGLTRVLGLS
jgi:predicted transposase YbfD/YdcC